MTGAVELTCPSCRAPLEVGDRFCERCGARLAEPDPDEPSAGDRIELDLQTAAAVSDRGRVHVRNEDAFYLEAVESGEVAVVICDGISTASASDIAARHAADTAGRTLVKAVSADVTGASVAVADAIEAARRSVQDVAWTTRADRGAPSCTLVCALCRTDEIVVGSVGDSRAYWIDRSGSRQLTVDDSWAEEQVAEGVMTVEQAMRDPRSHAITNWVGPDAPERPPRITVLRPERHGRLMLCTDGLWNYLASEDELNELVLALPTEASAAAVARALTETAIARGGRDNITTAVVDIYPDRSDP